MPAPTRDPPDSSRDIRERARRIEPTGLRACFGPRLFAARAPVIYSTARARSASYSRSGYRGVGRAIVQRRGACSVGRNPRGTPDSRHSIKYPAGLGGLCPASQSRYGATIFMRVLTLFVAAGAICTTDPPRSPNFRASWWLRRASPIPVIRLARSRPYFTSRIGKDAGSRPCLQIQSIIDHGRARLLTAGQLWPHALPCPASPIGCPTGTLTRSSRGSSARPGSGRPSLR
jgi:hypothetical protein